MKSRAGKLQVVFGLLTLAGVLCGCENDAASFEDPSLVGQSLTLIREQRVFWDDSVDVALVVARFPDCQRRHTLGASVPKKARVEIHRATGRAYLVNQQDNWYFADGETCQLEEVEAPDEGQEGELLGAFDRKDDRLDFISADAPDQGK